VVPGGGVALIRVLKLLANLEGANEDQTVGNRRVPRDPRIEIAVLPVGGLTLLRLVLCMSEPDRWFGGARPTSAAHFRCARAPPAQSGLL
jgi:hypothetical protein